MDPGREAQPGDMLQVIPRRAPALSEGAGAGTGSIRLQAVPARRRKLTRVVLAALAACTLILVAAVIARMARGNNESTAFAATSTGATGARAPMPTAPAPVVAPAPPAPEAPTTGTLRLQRPAVANKVWLDGQKIAAASATVTCGTHQVKVGAHGKAHSVDIPCGGELRLSH